MSHSANDDDEAYERFMNSMPGGPDDPRAERYAREEEAAARTMRRKAKLYRGRGKRRAAALKAEAAAAGPEAKESILARLMRSAKSGAKSGAAKTAMGVGKKALSVGGKVLGAGLGASGVVFGAMQLLDLLDELGVDLTGSKQKERRQLADDMTYEAQRGMFGEEDRVREENVIPMGIAQDTRNKYEARQVTGPDEGRMDQYAATTVDSLIRGREQQLAQAAVPMDQRPSMLEIAARMGAI